MFAKGFVQRAVSAYAGTFSEIRTFNLPESGSTETPVAFKVEGHLSQNPYPLWPHFATGLWYESGPMETVTVNVNGADFNLTPGSGIILYVNTYSPCTTITMDCKAKLTSEGKYTFSALTGYLQGDVFYYDDRVTKSVTVSKPTAPGAPEEWGLPWWWWIAALGGGAVLLTVVGVVAYQESQRQEMLMMMMARR